MTRKGKWHRRLWLRGSDRDAIFEKLAELKTPLYDGPSLSEEDVPRVRQRAKLIHEVLEWYREGELANELGLHQELVVVMDGLHTGRYRRGDTDESGTSSG